MDKRKLIADLSAKRSGLREGLDKLVAEAREAKRELTDDESARFDREEAEIRAADAEIQRLDEQIRADEQYAETMRRYAPKPGDGVTSEPEVYRRGAGGQSYFKDLYHVRQNGDAQAAERLRRNDRIVSEKRAISTANGAGGEFVPPLWLESEFVKLARPGRITANLLPTQALPAGTDSINIPKVNTGTATAIQTTQNSQVQQTDLTTTSISSSVFTVAGGQTISLQLLEQSPLNIDEIVLSDLAAAYAMQFNSLILTGSGTGGNPTGIMTLAGTNAIDLPAASNTAAGLYKAIGNAKAQIHTKRFLPADTIIMHPRRWEWLETQSDTTGRPLVVPAANSPMNALANPSGVAAEGYVGTMAGLPVFVDALIPTNLSADTGADEDAVLVMRRADLMVFESDIRAEAFQQTYAQNLSVFVRLYNYGSFQAGRYPGSISIITGAGLTGDNLFA